MVSAATSVEWVNSRSKANHGDKCMVYRLEDKEKWCILSLALSLFLVVAPMLAIEIMRRLHRPTYSTYEQRVDDFLNGKTNSIIMEMPDQVMYYQKWERVKTGSDK